jgi:hypothetical protein
MAGNLSDYAENKILELSTGKTAWSKPEAWAGLYTVAPTDSTAGTEVSGGSYVRIKVSDTTNSVFGAASAGTITNNGIYNSSSATTLTSSGTGIITFPKATDSWGTIVAVALLDASTGGNVLWYGTLTNTKTIDIDDTVSFAASDLQLSLD